MAVSALFNQRGPLLDVLPELLIDRTTGKNIVWATDTYEQYGAYYKRERQMFPDFNLNLILEGILLPRIQKTKEQQQARTKAKAEVFTPSWICNFMNNYCDEVWFERKAVFNTENADHTWTVNPEPISFPTTRSKKAAWQKYVDSRRIEITCGEAPYLISRYDTTTGEPIEIERRIGILDRKLRIVNENTTTESEWLKWAYRAFEATYGFEYQGDNLFFARVNLVQSFIDYYTHRFEKVPTTAIVKKIATIVSWNLWQMDGLKDTTPFGVPEDEYYQLSIFEEAKEKQPVYCRIKNWRGNNALEYRRLKGNTTMKFDFCIGNPPYQIITRDDGSGSAKAVYQYFIDAAENISNVICLITPARWQSDIPNGISLAWLHKMRTRHDIKMLADYKNSKDIFDKNVSVAGGVSIFVIDKSFNGDCKYISVENGVVTEVKGIFIKEGVIIRSTEMRSIIEKTSSERTVFEIMGTNRMFSPNDTYFSTNWEGYSVTKDEKHYLRYYRNPKKNAMCCLCM